jgi:hypothetical protein
MKKPSSSAADSAHEIGYGKPPKANQFRKGRSGNARGKQCGEENMTTIFKRIVSKRVKVKDGDDVRSITLANAVLLKNYNAAVQGNSLAIGNMFRLAEASGEFIDQTDAKQVGMPIAVPIRSKNMTEFLAQFGRKVGE